MIQVFYGLKKGILTFATDCLLYQAFLSGWRPPRPEKCLGEIYHIMIGTWYPDVSLRPKAQSVMRDINQILYEGTQCLINSLCLDTNFFVTSCSCLVYNSRRSNVYELVNDQRSLNGSLASGLTEATSTHLKISLTLLYN